MIPTYAVQDFTGNNVFVNVNPNRVLKWLRKRDKEAGDAYSLLVMTIDNEGRVMDQVSGDEYLWNATTHAPAVDDEKATGWQIYRYPVGGDMKDAEVVGDPIYDVERARKKARSLGFRWGDRFNYYVEG